MKLTAAAAAAWLGVACTRAGWDPPTRDRSDGQLPVLSARRVSGDAIRVDGRLDEAAWQTAVDTGDSSIPGRERQGRARG
jgi:hypothetical protein